MSRPNPIEGIEPSEVFQASCQYRMLVVSVYQTYLYDNKLRKDSPLFIYRLIYIFLNRVLRHKTSSFITIQFEAPHSLHISVLFYCL